MKKLLSIFIITALSFGPINQVFADRGGVPNENSGKGNSSQSSVNGNTDRSPAIDVEEGNDPLGLTIENYGIRELYTGETTNYAVIPGGVDIDGDYGFTIPLELEIIGAVYLTDSSDSKGQTFTVNFPEDNTKEPVIYKTVGTDIVIGQDNTINIEHKNNNKIIGIGIMIKAIDNTLESPIKVKVEVEKVADKDGNPIVGGPTEDVFIRVMPKRAEIESIVQIREFTEWMDVDDGKIKGFYGNEIEVKYLFKINEEFAYDPKIDLIINQNDVFRITNPVVEMEIEAVKYVLDVVYKYVESENKSHIEIEFIDKTINYGEKTLELKLYYDLLMKNEHEISDFMPIGENGQKLQNWMFPYIISDVNYDDKSLSENLSTVSSVEWSSVLGLEGIRDNYIETSETTFEFKNKNLLPDGF
jgi:hypothetical protein